MARGRRTPQRRGGRTGRDTRLPINDEINARNSEGERQQSPRANQPSNPSPRSVAANEHGRNTVISDTQVNASLHGNPSSNDPPRAGGQSSIQATRKRSAYRGQALEKENNRRKGKMVVEFTSSGGRPLTVDQSSKLASEMGKACRDLLPLCVDDWRKFPISEKQQAWERVQNRLNIDDVMKNVGKFRAADSWMGGLHRNHRSKTKRKWKELGDAARPKGSNDDDWKKAIEQWAKEIQEEREILKSEDPSTKRTRSMIGKDARSYVKYLHKGGSRSFESRRNEQIRQNCQPSNAIEFFKETRYCNPKPDGMGGWVSQQAKEDYDKMVKMYEDSQASDNPLTPEQVVDIFMNASKRSDYHPGRGYGPPAIGRSSQRRIHMEELENALREERNLCEQQTEQLAQLTQMVQQLVKDFLSASRIPNRRDHSPTPSDHEDSEEGEDED